MMTIIVNGRPVPYKRTTQRQKFVDKSYHKYRDYKEKVRQYCQGNISFGDLPVTVKVVAFLHGGGKMNMGRDADVDNYIKSALDSMNGVIYNDDRQVIKVFGAKKPCTKDEERLEIYIYDATE